MKYPHQKIHLVDEFKRIRPWLAVAAAGLDMYFQRFLHKQMVVTSIMRNVQTQMQLCKKHDFKSDFQHCVGEAMDIRSSNITDTEEARAIECVESRFPWCKLTAHKKGTAPHLHLNLKARDRAAVWALIRNHKIDEEEFRVDEEEFRGYFTG
jgi:hypothetical protein